MSDWWLSRASGAPEGPFPSQTLVQGLISGQVPSQAYVCRVGAQQWIVISQVDELWEVAFPEQAKTKVTEQPWFAQGIDARTTAPKAAAQAVAENTERAARLLTPLPIVTPQEEPITVPLQTRNAAARKAVRTDGAPALPGALPVPSPRPLPTPLPKPRSATEISGRSAVSGTRVPVVTAPTTTSPLASTPTVEAYRAQIPTLEGIQAQSSESSGSGTTLPQGTPHGVPSNPLAAPKGAEPKAPGIGFVPLPKALQANQRPHTGIGALPAKGASFGDFGLPGAAAGSAHVAPPAQPAASAQFANPLPPILGTSGTPAPLAQARSFAQSTPSANASSETANASADPGMMMSAIADFDEVTTIASNSRVEMGAPISTEGDDDVTTIVTGIDPGDAPESRSTGTLDDSATTAIRTRVAPNPNVAEVRHPDAPAAKSSGHTASAKNAYLQTDAVPEVHGPEDLLEADIDDTSARIHSVPPIPTESRVRKERPMPAAIPGSPTGPVISVPPKATHIVASPSVVLKSEPIVHQEATKPAVRALKPPGVIQISYGTLVVAILGIAFLLLLIVLLLR